MTTATGPVGAGDRPRNWSRAGALFSGAGASARGRSTVNALACISPSLAISHVAMAAVTRYFIQYSPNSHRLGGSLSANLGVSNVELLVRATSMAACAGVKGVMSSRKRGRTTGLARSQARRTTYRLMRGIPRKSRLPSFTP